MEESDARVAVVEHVASDVELLVGEKQRTNVVLNEAVLLQVPVF